jgi:hypothetical protein
MDVAVDADERRWAFNVPFIICPYCGGDFAVADTEPVEAPPEDRRDSELDALRIRQVSTARRAAIRVRTYLLVGVITCAAGVAQLVVQTVKHVRHEKRFDVWAIVYVVGAIAILAAAIYFLSRWRAMGRELAQPVLEEPTTPPDFSTLSDGAEPWKNLEDVR